MIRVLLHGACGRMGHVIADLAKSDERLTIVEGVDARGEAYADFPVRKDLSECTEEADVVIDFSNASAADHLLDYCAAKGLPVVLCTTGLSDAQISHVNEAAKKTAVLRSANMSIGINLLLKILKEAAPKLAAAGFDCEIVEMHHNNKLDAPSGTALALADAVNSSLDNTCAYVYDRTQRREKRPKNEIGISSVRAGSIVGDHDVIFAGQDEVVTFTHRAYSRNIFAKGALAAAAYLAGKPAGLYDMQDVLA